MKFYITFYLFSSILSFLFKSLDFFKLFSFPKPILCFHKSVCNLWSLILDALVEHCCSQDNEFMGFLYVLIYKISQRNQERFCIELQMKFSSLGEKIL